MRLSVEDLRKLAWEGKWYTIKRKGPRRGKVKVKKQKVNVTFSLKGLTLEQLSQVADAINRRLNKVD